MRAEELEPGGSGAGAGRPGLEREPGLSEGLDRLIDPVTRGIPSLVAVDVEERREAGGRRCRRWVMRSLIARCWGC